MKKLRRRPSTLPCNAGRPRSEITWARSWWLLPAPAFLFAIALAIGLLAKLYGSPGPDLAWDESLIPGRTTAQTGVSMSLDTLFSPVGNIIILLLTCLVLAFGLR